MQPSRYRRHRWCPTRSGRSIVWGRWLLAGLFVVGFAANARAQATCADWCGAMNANCKAESIQPVPACVSYCEHPNIDVLPAGTPGDATGDTLDCRFFHAEQAGLTTGATREAHCAAAAASGNQTCGSYCDVYCRLALETCTSANPDHSGPDIYVADGGLSAAEACAASCGGFSTDVLEGISQPEQQFGYDDTIQCRLHHIQAALIEGQESASNYALHCEHASEASTSVTCGPEPPPNSVNYCNFATTFCTGPDALFPPGTSHGTCVGILNPIVASGDYRSDPFESFTDTDTNSLGCLNYWIMLAPLDASANCAKGDWDPVNWAPAGGGVCAASTSSLPTGRWVPGFVAALVLLAAALMLGRRFAGTDAART